MTQGELMQRYCRELEGMCHIEQYYVRTVLMLMSNDINMAIAVMKAATALSSIYPEVWAETNRQVAGLTPPEILNSIRLPRPGGVG